ncbi:MAG TPA: caspase family protein [Myxococcota bacterium]|nr:caspase family protein [Myxococcota bacterium]
MFARNAVFFMFVFVLARGWLPALAGDSPAVSSGYALLIGSNRAGPGQEELRYAHRDAESMAEVLTQIGGYEPARVLVLLDPARDEIISALAKLQEQIRARVDLGEPSQLLFYYSGHARAHALNMGSDEIGLEELRRLLIQKPATVTLAVLDACQTGAISRVKGAEPAADFSYNSVNRLNTAGVAVMASSAASELSQESEILAASYFTSNLVAGLRGAADNDSDGRVTLREAYRYAYNRTLADTAATAVGKQHPTLETELRGKGEMILSWPARASAALVLDKTTAGEVLVQHERGGSIVAELHKVAGEKMRLALPPGKYTVVVRDSNEAFSCDLDLQEGAGTTIDLDYCHAIPPEEAVAKGPQPWREHWGIELGLGAWRSVSDGYSQRLDDFGYEKQLFDFDETFTITAAGLYSINRYLAVGIGFGTLSGGSYRREVYDLDGEQRDQTFDWSAYGIGPFVRGTLPLIDGILNPFLQAGCGLAFGRSVYRDPLQASEVVDDQLHWGYEIFVGAGLNVMIWDNFGIFGQVSYTFAPLVENLMGDIHDSGGPSFVLGIRGAL